MITDSELERMRGLLNRLEDEDRWAVFRCAEKTVESNQMSQDIKRFSESAVLVQPDILAWFKKTEGENYDVRINEILREAMQGKSIEDTLRKIIQQELKR